MLFGQIRDGAEHLHGAEIASNASSVGELVDWLRRRDEAFAVALDRPGLRFAVDQRFADLETVITPQSEVAVMSPLSGG
jgi:molybdopterin converting factor small subunit